MPRSPDRIAKYWVVICQSPDAAVIDAFPDGGPDGYEYHLGVPLGKKFPKKGAVVRFSANFSDARKLVDFQPNLLRALILSPKARAVMEQLELDNAEFLPLSILDHRGKVAGKDYAILNLLGSEDAVDLQKSVVRMGHLDKTQANRIKKLVVNHKSIRPQAKLFRCSIARDVYLIRDDAREAIEAAGLAGMKLVPTDSWNGLYI